MTYDLFLIQIKTEELVEVYSFPLVEAVQVFAYLDFTGLSYDDSG